MTIFPGSGNDPPQPENKETRTMRLTGNTCRQLAGRRAPGHGVLVGCTPAAAVPLFPLQPLSAEFRVRAGDILHRRTARTLAAAMTAPMYQSLRLTRRADQRVATQFRLLRGEGGAR